MNTLSNERLEEIAMYGAQYNTPESRDMDRELLALHKEREAAVPTYYLNQVDYGDGEGFELKAYFRELDAMKSKEDFGGVVIPVYTYPPAQPVAALINANVIDSIVTALNTDGLDEDKHCCELALYHDRERIRKALLEYFSAQPFAVPDEITVWADSKSPEKRFWQKGWNACRAAMLKEAK